DMGYADVSCYGRRDLVTPNIDRLAAEGLRFTQSYANSAVCTASRVALITGRYQYRLPIGLEEPLARRNIGLPPDHPTLPFLLSLHFNAPHWPWEGPSDEVEAKRIKSLFHFDGGTQRTYREMIQQMDLQIGRVLQALDRDGAAADTIVIFTSDNGGERYAD